MQYNFFADLLSKFHTAPEFIQALIIISGVVVSYFITAILKTVVQCFRSAQSKKDNLTMQTLKGLDQVVYKLIAEYESTKSSLETVDNTHLSIILQRIKEAEVVIEFIRNNKR